MPEATNVVQFPRKSTEPLGSLGDTTASLTTSKPGDKGANVSALQAALASWGFQPGAVDGIYGANTTAAVKRLQTALHVTADGIFGANTLRTVQADLAVPTGILPKKGAANPALPATPVAQQVAAAATTAVLNKKLSPLMIAGLGLVGLGGLFFIVKAFSGSSAPAPSAPPPAPSAAPPTPGIAGGDFFDGDEEIEVEGEVVRKKAKRKPRKKAKALAAVNPKRKPKKTEPEEEEAEFEEYDVDSDPDFDDETMAQDLPDDYDFEGDDLIRDEFEESPEA